MQKIATDRIAQTIEDIGDDWCIVGRKSHRHGTWSYEFRFPGAWRELQEALKQGRIVSIQDSASFSGESVLYAKRARPTFLSEIQVRPSRVPLAWD